MIRFSRRWHRRLMLITGLQFLLWTASGFYMVLTDIHFIHGESLISQQKQDIDWQQVTYSVNALRADYPDANDVSLSMFSGSPVYRFRDKENDDMWKMLSARNGKVLQPLSQTEARTVAISALSTNAPIVSTRLFTSEGPDEVNPRHLPYWQVTFEGWMTPTLYVSAATGDIVTVRHNFWRIFDWMWRLHIMDWDDGSDVDNIILISFAVSGLLAAILGAHLTLFHFKRPVKKWVKG